MIKSYYNVGGVKTNINPVSPEQDGVLIHGVNIDTYPQGAKTRRVGYGTYLNNPDGAQVNSLWQWQRNNGTQFWNYRASGSKVYYSTQGTGDWTVCGNGTISNGGYVGHAVLKDTMVIGDGVGSTRHTTDGTSFTNTTGAPVAPFFEQYNNRIFAIGTSSFFTYSTGNDPTDWATSGTSDSASLNVPGGGKLSQPFRTADRLILPKNNGEMYSWDMYAIVDLATKRGSNGLTTGDAEGYKIYTNRYGVYGYGGGKPEVLTTPIQRQFQSRSGQAISGISFDTTPGLVHYNDYFVSLGSVLDEFTNRQMTNTVLKYDFVKEEFAHWSLAVKPTAFSSDLMQLNYTALHFGDAAGVTYEMSPWIGGDNGAVIASEMVFFFTLGWAQFDKEWKWWRGNFNPGCQLQIQVACSDVFDYSRLKWEELGNAFNGFVQYRLPKTRSKYLFVRLYGADVEAPWSFYGQSISAQLIGRSEDE